MYVSAGIPEVNMKANPSLPLNMSSSMKRPRVHSPPPRPAYHNGSQHSGAREAPGSQERLSEEEEEQAESGQDEEEDEEEDEREMEEVPRRWSGIEAIFEAYQEYTEGGLSSMEVTACVECSHQVFVKCWQTIQNGILSHRKNVPQSKLDVSSFQSGA